MLMLCDFFKNKKLGTPFKNPGYAPAPQNINDCNPRVIKEPNNPILQHILICFFEITKQKNPRTSQPRLSDIHIHKFYFIKKLKKNVFDENVYSESSLFVNMLNELFMFCAIISVSMKIVDKKLL